MKPGVRICQTHCVGDIFSSHKSLSVDSRCLRTSGSNKKNSFEISSGRVLRKSTFYVSSFVSHLTLWQELQKNVRPRQLAYRRRSRQFTSLLQWSTEFPSPVFNFLHVRIGKKTKCETDFPKFQTSFHRSVCNTTTWDTNGGISSQFSKICHSYAHNWYVMGNLNIFTVLEDMPQLCSQLVCNRKSVS